MSAKQPIETPVEEALPQSGGSYIRQPDGSLVEQKPKAELADLVAAKRASAEQPTNTQQE
jgi:hypothetical protein